MPSRVCSVRHCRYIAEGAIEDFVVCALHDAPQTRGILEQLMAPAAYYGPIVLPCGPLLESDFEPREAHPDAIRAADDPRISDGPPKMTHPNYDLTR